MIMGDEYVEGGLRAGLQFGDEFGFVTAPGEGAGPIRHAVPFWRDSPLSYWGSLAVRPSSPGLCCNCDSVPFPLPWLDTGVSEDVSEALLGPKPILHSR